MAEFGLLLPELYLAATVLGLVLSESAYHGEKVRLVLPTALLGVGGALIQTILSYRQGPTLLFGGALSLDGFSLFFKLLFLLFAAIAVAAVCLSDEIEEEIRSEFCAILLVGTVSLMVAAESANLFVSALALQAAGAVGYVLSAMARKNALPIEAGVKWFSFNALSGACLLLAAAALFLQTGTGNLHEIHSQLIAAPPPPKLSMLFFSIFFLGLSIPMMVFPAHFWATDVLQGAPSAAGSFLAAALRAGAFAVAARLWVSLFAQPAIEPGKWIPLGSWDWTHWIAVSAGITLLLPAVLSIQQRDAKRLLACVALVQGGFLLFGLLILEEIGLSAILFSLLIDVLSLVGVYYVLSLSVVRAGGAETIRLRGALRGRPWEAVALLCFAVSWLGLPPFAGSIGRFALLGAAVRREWYVLAFLGLVAMALTVVSTGRLLLTLLLPVESAARQSPTPEQHRLFLAVLMIPLFLAGIFAESLLRWASLSLQFIFW